MVVQWLAESALDLEVLGSIPSRCPGISHNAHFLKAKFGSLALVLEKGRVAKLVERPKGPSLMQFYDRGFDSWPRHRS